MPALARDVRFDSKFLSVARQEDVESELIDIINTLCKSSNYVRISKDWYPPMAHALCRTR
eukprot:3727057-Pleurochrysis_carterae.AAC.2